MAKEKVFKIVVTKGNFGITSSGFSDVELIGILSIEIDLLKTKAMSRSKEPKSEIKEGE